MADLVSVAVASFARVRAAEGALRAHPAWKASAEAVLAEYVDRYGGSGPLRDKLRSDLDLADAIHGRVVRLVLAKMDRPTAAIIEAAIF
jgi:hypothetical protein